MCLKTITLNKQKSKQKYFYMILLFDLYKRKKVAFRGCYTILQATSVHNILINGLYKNTRFNQSEYILHL